MSSSHENGVEEVPSRTSYYHGLPGRCRRELRRSLRSELGCLIPLLLCFGLGTWLYADWVIHGANVLSVLGLMLFGVPFCLLSASLVLTVARTVRDGAQQTAAHIVPYFDQPLGLRAEDAPGGGYALARNCSFLDKLAVRRGVTRLTGLGLDDDLGDESPRWRNPQTGLTTVRALLEELDAAASAAGMTDPETLRAELEKIEAALVKAQEHGASFCLLLRISPDNRVKPRGVDLREGSFW